MSKNSFTPEELEQIRGMLEEAIRENVPKSQQVEAQQLIPDLITLIATLLGSIPAAVIAPISNIVSGATGILSSLITSLIGILNQLLGVISGANGAGASIMQALTPSLVNVITRHVPVSEAQKQHIQQQIEQQLASKNPNPEQQNNE
ncbi:MAG: hypothetical protein WB502_13215 [Thermoactinomyces sp.]